MLVSIIRAVIHPKGLTKQVALWADLGWMSVVGIMLCAMLWVH